MKTTILFAAILCCTQISASTLPVQPLTSVIEKKSLAPSFAFVRGHKQGKNHTVTWGMNNNAGISNFIVECTYEDPNDTYSVWQTAGITPCTSSPIFKFIDSPVLPGVLSYRIVAIMNDNSTIVSGIYSVYVSGS